MSRFNFLHPVRAAKTFAFLAIALVATAILGLIVYQAYKYATRTRHVSNVVNVDSRAQINAEWSFGRFERMTGTDYVMAPAHSKQMYQQTYQMSSYNKDASAVRNYLFVNTLDKESRWLIPANNYLFLNAEKLGRQDTKQEDEAVKWMRYDVVKSDTNGDQRLTYEDKRTIAVSSATGEGYTEVIQGVDELLGTVMRDENTLLVFHSTDGTSFVSEVDLPGRRVTVTKELPKIQAQ